MCMYATCVLQFVSSLRAFRKTSAVLAIGRASLCVVSVVGLLCGVFELHF